MNVTITEVVTIELGNRKLVLSVTEARVLAERLQAMFPSTTYAVCNNRMEVNIPDIDRLTLPPNFEVGGPP